MGLRLDFVKLWARRLRDRLIPVLDLSYIFKKLKTASAAGTNSPWDFQLFVFQRDVNPGLFSFPTRAASLLFHLGSMNFGKNNGRAVT